MRFLNASTSAKVNVITVKFSISRSSWFLIDDIFIRKVVTSSWSSSTILFSRSTSAEYNCKPQDFSSKSLEEPTSRIFYSSSLIFCMNNFYFSSHVLILASYSSSLCLKNRSALAIESNLISSWEIYISFKDMTLLASVRRFWV